MMCVDTLNDLTKGIHELGSYDDLKKVAPRRLDGDQGHHHALTVALTPVRGRSKPMPSPIHVCSCSRSADQISSGAACLAQGKKIEQLVCNMNAGATGNAGRAGADRMRSGPSRTMQQIQAYRST